MTCTDLSADPVPVGITTTGTASIGIRPQHLTPDPDGGSHRVEFTERLGGVTYVHVSAPSGARVVVEVAGDSELKKGERIGLSFDPANVLAFDADSEARLR